MSVQITDKNTATAIKCWLTTVLSEKGAVPHPSRHSKPSKSFALLTLKASRCSLISYHHRTDNGLTDRRPQPTHIWLLTRASNNPMKLSGEIYVLSGQEVDFINNNRSRDYHGKDIKVG